MSVSIQRIRSNGRSVALIIGSALVTIWTLLRFFEQRTVFDTISQQVVVNQWLHGSMSAAHLGQTAYVLKMLFLYVPLELLPGSPRLKLILATLAINIVTFLLIALVLKKILELFEIKTGDYYNASLLWLAGIAGSVFWIGFINSRNIEVAGGLYLLYLSLGFLQTTTRKRGFYLAAFAGVLFFADPLQLYMSALPLLVYSAALSVRDKSERLKTLYLAAIFLTGYAVSIGLFALAHYFLLLSFSGTGGVNAPTLTSQWVAASLKGTLKASVTLFAGAADTGRLRELINILLLLLGAGGFSFALFKKWLPRRGALFILTLFVVDELVYILSGQAAQPGTSRYLIMMAPIAAFGIAAVRLPKRVAAYFIATFVAGAVINLGALALALGGSWNTSFPADAHIASVFRYMETQPAAQVYASIDTAMPILYYRDLPAQSVLPLGCLSGSLTRTYYSMDKAFQVSAKQRPKTVAIILDGTAISNSPNVCDETSLITKFGMPMRVEATDDHSTVLLYEQAALDIR